MEKPEKRQNKLHTGKGHDVKERKKENDGKNQGVFDIRPFQIMDKSWSLKFL